MVLSVNSCDWKCRHSLFDFRRHPSCRLRANTSMLAIDCSAMPGAWIPPAFVTVTPWSRSASVDVISAGEGAREQLQSVGAIEAVGVERDPGHHAGLRYEFALLGRGPSERDRLVRESLAERVRVRRHR